ncbi:MAG: hypothetical protein P8J17_12735 [Halioglobus sp.]|nr:hypothetical protein [Halioglobus sp.]
MISLILIPPAYAASTTAVTLRVGPERSLKFPSDAARLARRGDIIEIDAGVYHNDYANWDQDNLTIRGVGGIAHLQSTDFIPTNKAIWIINGDNTIIENMEFSGAKVKDRNGAGIRLQGGNLTLRNLFFHDNEFSILTGELPDSSITIDSSRFWFQKRKDTFTHGIYIGAIKRFTIIGSHVKGTELGHQIKTRALENHILYNRIEDTFNGNSSRLIDLPNCGLSFIIGNDLHQALTTQNVDAIGYGAENCDQRSEQQKHLYAVNNTFINEAWSGTLIKNHVGGDILVANNLIMGRGYFLLGKGTKINNGHTGLSLREPRTWLPLKSSVAIDGAAELDLWTTGAASLQPARVFTPPTGTSERILTGRLDLGSRELQYDIEDTVGRH